MSTAKKPPNLTDPNSGGERHQGFRALGEAISKLAAPVAVRRGGGVLARLKADWSAIVGPEWAAAWPAAFAPGGVLKLRARPAAALELQHRAPLLIDRINLYLGRTAVTRLVLVQANLPLVAATVESASRSSVVDGIDGSEARLSGIADPGLRAALGRLARAVTMARG
jgi:hypothetical protein